MNVPISWLNEFTDANIDLHELSEKLTMSGSKVEGITQFGVKVTNTITAKVESIESHPSSDKLRVMKINTGKEILTVVANIPNLNVGNIIPLALDGAVLSNGNIIQKGEVKGVMSEAMVVPIFDLGLNRKQLTDAEENGLYVFSKDTKLGEDINTVMSLGSDIIEFEITPNRPDCLSILGIAREIAATLGKPYKDITRENRINNKVDSIEGFNVEIKTDKCLRYTAKVVKNVKVKASPIWMQERLRLSGIRPINNIVDITNYVMLELGAPMHAFDLDLLEGKKVTVRQAKEGEKIVILDGTEKLLTSDDMVIADNTKATAIAGIMGGEFSGINDNTNTIVFEAAMFMRGSVRLTSKRVGVRTESSARFEKGLPSELTQKAIDRACNLIELLNAGTVLTDIIDIYPVKQEIVRIELDYDKINKFIGIDLAKEEMIKILNAVSIEVVDDTAIVPYFRQDVEGFVDIAEEIARFYGYDKLPSTNITSTQTMGRLTRKQKLERKIKGICVGGGYSEVLTYTFYNKGVLDKLLVSDTDALRNSVEIINPLNADYAYMRTTMAPAMIKCLENNYLKKNKDVSLFEISRVYLEADNIKKGIQPLEKMMLCVGTYGSYGYFEIKGLIENILENCNITEYEFERLESVSYYHPGKSSKLIVRGRELASIGQIHPKVISNFNLPKEIYIAELDFEYLNELSCVEIKHKEIARYPALERDLALVVKNDIMSGEIQKTIKNAANELLEDVVLFDIYTGDQIEEGYKSMAYSLKFRSNDRTLNEEDISFNIKNIMEALESKLNIEIRR